MTALLLTLLSNKAVLGVLGALGAILGIYLKGYSSGKSAVRADDIKAQDQLNQEVKSAEATNQNIEQKRAEDTQKISTTDDVNKLIGLWNSSYNKAPGSDSEESPK